MIKNLLKYNTQFFIIFFILSIFSFPKISLANPLWYGNIISVNNNEAIIQFRGLENKNYYSCNLENLICIPLKELPPDSSTTPSKEQNLKTSVKFPTKSERKNISQTKRYGFYYTFDSSKKIRTLGLIDGKTKKYYSIKEKLNFWNLLNQQPHVSRFAKDDSTLTYMSDRSGFASLYLLSLNNLSNKKFLGTQITSGVTVGDFLYADNETILYVANTKLNPYNWILYSYNITTKQRTVLAEQLLYDTILHQFGNSIIYTNLTPLGTSPVILTDFHGGEIKEFTGVIQTPSYTRDIKYNFEKISGLNTVEMNNPNTNTQESPLIVWLHGGPYRQSSFIRHPYISYGVYDWILEEAILEGASVLKIDYPGSYGDGRIFTENIKGGVGKIDINSVMDTINTYTKSHKVNGIYIVGNSYGGYMALKFMSSYPDKITGGLSINGVTDWKALLSYYKTSIFNTFFNGLPSKTNNKLYAQASILNNTKKIINPVYIIQAELDSTIPKSQAFLLKKSLDNNNIKSEIILIPEENHIFLKNSSINTICNALFEMIKIHSNNRCKLEG
jgi:dipeptidyl aminopeptidase/acylaminoacyl peptidase